jgi:molybdate transport system regulatory protein
LGFKLVETQTGGAGGGGAQLTPECHEIIDQYNQLVAGLDSQLKKRFQSIFADELPDS